jgi:hypothetical protein
MHKARSSMNEPTRDTKITMMTRGESMLWMDKGSGGKDKERLVSASGTVIRRYSHTFSAHCF